MLSSNFETPKGVTSVTLTRTLMTVVFWTSSTLIAATVHCDCAVSSPRQIRHLNLHFSACFDVARHLRWPRCHGAQICPSVVLTVTAVSLVIKFIACFVTAVVRRTKTSGLRPFASRPYSGISLRGRLRTLPGLGRAASSDIFIQLVCD